MPEPKRKTESYDLLGGINVKASQYDTGPNEFLNIVNYDFTTPGSLTQRYGYTSYVGASVIGRILGLYEYNKLSGFSQIMVGANTNLYFIGPSSFTPIRTGLGSSGLYDFSTFVDYLFVANGTNFFKYNGQTSTFFSLPNGPSIATGLIGLSTTPFVHGYNFKMSYINERGYVGPPSSTFIFQNGNGASAIVISPQDPIPSGYGITAVALFVDSGSGDFFRSVTLYPPGTTIVVPGPTIFLTDETAPTTLFFTLAPKYLEIYSNRLFMAGVSTALSTMFFSEVGDPEAIEPEFNIEVRTNDGNRITGMRPYQGSLVVTKQDSIHELSGDNPQNFNLREVNNQYGCISNRTMVQWQDRLWFLDRKGIVEYNGANTRVVSNRIEQIFLNMNLDAALENAIGFHNKFRNEVWFAIPTDGATLNNLTVVYDYVADAWTKFDGFRPSSMGLMRGGLTSPMAFFGGYSGTVFNFHPSLTQDNGDPFAVVCKTRFHDAGSESTEQQWRRCYLNIEPKSLGPTIMMNLYKDYGASIELTRYFPPTPFQTRIDFGVPAVAISLEFSHLTTSEIVRMYGYTLESRLQRLTTK